jgi:hypothetical protein
VGRRFGFYAVDNMLLFGEENIPLWLVLGEDLPLRVVPNVSDVDITA